MYRLRYICAPGIHLLQIEHKPGSFLGVLILRMQDSRFHRGDSLQSK